MELMFTLSSQLLWSCFSRLQLGASFHFLDVDVESAMGCEHSVNLWTCGGHWAQGNKINQSELRK